MFIIPPDYHSGTSLLQASIAAKSKRLWQSLRREYGIPDCHYSDYFDFAFTKIAHRSRVTDTARLRLRFTDETKEDYLFKPEYSKRVPARTLGKYMEGIWVRSVKMQFIIFFHTKISQEFLQQEGHSHPPTHQQLLAAFGSIAKLEGFPGTPCESSNVLLSMIEGYSPPQHGMIGPAPQTFNGFVARGGSSAQ